MGYHINTTSSFDKQLRKLAKRHSSITADVDLLRLSLADNPFQGDGLGKGLFKVRMKIKSKGKGKSGGARVITLVEVTDETVTLVAIYDKSDMATISDNELKNLF